MKRQNVTTWFAAALTAITLTLASGVSWAQEEKPTADLTVAALSQYIWRGQELSQDSVVLQPSMTVEYMGLGFNLWGNLDTDNYADDTNNWNETDMTLSYSTSVGMVSLEGGYIYYALDGALDSQEIYASVGLDTLLSPTLTVYREIGHYPSWYITADISHSIELPQGMSLDLEALVAYLASDDSDAYPEIDGRHNPTGDEFNNFHEGTISAALNIPVGQYVTVTPQVYWTFALLSLLHI